MKTSLEVMGLKLYLNIAGIGQVVRMVLEFKEITTQAKNFRPVVQVQ